VTRSHGLQPLGDLQRTDWTATNGAKGRGDVGSWFMVISDREFRSGEIADRAAGTDLDLSIK